MTDVFVSMPKGNFEKSKRARFLFRVRNEKALEGDEQLAATQSHGVLSQKRYMEITGNKVVAALAGTEKFTHVEADDFVISLRTFEGGIERSSEAGCISPAYTVMKPSKDVFPSFYHYLLKSQIFISYLQTTVTGIRDGKSVKFENFSNIILPAPDLSTQRAIADFLDRETARIDALIEKKQRLVELMGDKKRSTVAKVLSAIEAAYWRVRHLGKFKNGAGFPIELQGDASHDIPFFKVKHLAINGLDQRIMDSDDTITESMAKQLRAMPFPAGTIIFAKIGAALLLGRFAMIGKRGCIDNNLAAFVVNERLVDPNFMLICFERFGMPLMVQPGAVPSLNTETFLGQSVPLPPLDKQRAVVSAIRAVVKRNEDVTRLTQTSIDRLKEFRSALITSAVTGQIDVTDYGRSGTTARHIDTIEEAASV